MALIVQNCYILGSAIYRQRQMVRLTRTIEETTDVGLLLASMQTERSEMAYHVFGINVSGTWTAEDGFAVYDREHSLRQVFDRTDLALDKLVDWRAIAGEAGLQWQDRMFASKGRFQTYLGDIRRMVLEGRTPSRSEMLWYNRTTALLLRVLVRHISDRKLSSGDVSSPFLAYINIMRAVEHLGLLLTLGLRYLSTGTSPLLVAQTALSDTLFWEYIGNTRTFASGIADNMSDILEEGDGMGTFMVVRDGIINDVPRASLNVSATEFFHNNSRLLNRLQQVQRQLKENIESLTSDEVLVSRL
ncbi:uncharacterized protein LOC122367506 [Amphibalanus amphitrite]|uniref:uncharacterized protein LOC122367506 n=1 Tax=Amphibalanus amphitrite TaxID=1232801 RepID=UPI001C915561|nr:uncharacterized protein LOC122367506 [Amphibalanus amphitrite]